MKGKRKLEQFEKKLISDMSQWIDDRLTDEIQIYTDIVKDENDEDELTVSPQVIEREVDARLDEIYTQALSNYSKMLPGLQDAFSDELNDQLYV